MLNYYRIMMDDSLKAQNHILLNILDWNGFDNCHYQLFEGKKIDSDLIFYAEANSKKIEADYLLSAYAHIVSNEIKNIIEENNIEAQFFPIIIKNRDLLKKYFVLNMINKIPCENLDKSKFTIDVYDKNKSLIYSELKQSEKNTNYVQNYLNNSHYQTYITFTHPFISKNVVNDKILFTSTNNRIALYCDNIFVKEYKKKNLLGVEFSRLKSE